MDHHELPLPQQLREGGEEGVLGEDDGHPAPPGLRHRAVQRLRHPLLQLPDGPGRGRRADTSR